MIDVACANDLQRVLQVVAVVGKISREPVQEVRAPRLGVHRIDRMHARNDVDAVGRKM